MGSTRTRAIPCSTSAAALLALAAVLWLLATSGSACVHHAPLRFFVRLFVATFAMLLVLAAALTIVYIFAPARVDQLVSKMGIEARRTPRPGPKTPILAFRELSATSDDAPSALYLRGIKQPFSASRASSDPALYTPRVLRDEYGFHVIMPTMNEDDWSWHARDAAGAIVEWCVSTGNRFDAIVAHSHGGYIAQWILREMVERNILPPSQVALIATAPITHDGHVFSAPFYLQTPFLPRRALGAVWTRLQTIFDWTSESIPPLPAGSLRDTHMTVHIAEHEILFAQEAMTERTWRKAWGDVVGTLRVVMHGGKNHQTVVAGASGALFES